MHRLLPLLLVAGCATAPGSDAPWSPDSETTRAADLREARDLFERNLSAIRDRDRDAYLACYRDSPYLVRAGPEGASLGFDALAEGTGETWPDALKTHEMQVHWIRSGVVYGIYRYEVAFPGQPVAMGISERLFLRGKDGWRIAVTTAFPAPGLKQSE